jgi:outer membrane receptor protein involved in Fe transport
MNLNFITSVITLLIGFISFGQSGSISGKVTDSTTGETIPGAKITVESMAKGAMTDLDGNFLIQNLAVGAYSLNISYYLYNTKIVTDILVKGNDVTTVTISLDKTVREIGPITVKVTINKESNTNLLQLQRNSASTVDGISSESIKKSPDRAASDVLKRISGASVQDNKFVIIRGLNDRYNTAMINGLPLPSTEADRKAFSFDIFPSAMLDNMLIYKTASPDLPGDFAGGVIQINTKDIPEKDFISVSAGANYNSQSTFKEYSTYDGSKNDWIGSGASDRSLPSDLVSTTEFKKLLSDPNTRFENSKIFDNDWGITNKKSSPLGQNYQIGFAKNLKLKKNEFGFVGGLTYNYNRRFLDVTRSDYNEDSSRVFDYKDATYRENVTLGAMLNFAYKIGENNKITLKNMFSNNSTDQVIKRTGENIDADQIVSATTQQYTSNKMLSSQLSGEHLLEKTKIKMKWGLNYSKTQSSVPNLKRMLYYKNRTLQGTKADSVYSAYVPFGSPSPDYAGRFFSDLNEDLFAGMAEINIPYKMLNQNSFIKVGYAGSIKARAFDARVFGYAVNNPAKFNYDFLYLPQDSIFAEENMKVEGFKLGEMTNPSDSYTASSDLHAGYLMTDQKFGTKFRAVYGLRIENFNQKLNSLSYGGDTIKIDNTTLSYLPSINLTYSPTKKINIRGAASRTVARPDFRELAPFSFYDFNSSSAVVGNDTLKPSDITNLDLRFEFFPGNGQILSTSFFYKDFLNPIENTVFFGGSGSRTYTYRNVANAVDYGVELEFRTKLSFIDSLLNTEALDDFTVFTNLTLVKSVVDLSNVPQAVTEEEKRRPMQGQSPYLINAGLIYQNEEKGFGVSLMFNRIGRRIAFVGTNGYQDIYENPRSILDFQITKRILKNGELKLNISDIFNQKAVFYQDFNLSKKYEEGVDKQITGIKYGRNITLSFLYNF